MERGILGCALQWQVDGGQGIGFTAVNKAGSATRTHSALA
jgi:hypothetical protein